MCKYSSLIYITSKSGLRIPFIKTCGRCKDCLMSSRAGQVIRMKKEFTACKSCFFVTLKYRDENLVYWNFNKTERRRELDRVKALPKSKPFGTYDKFILEPRHASKFFEDMQKVIKSYSKNLLFRIVLNGEYGTWSHRPHMHAIIYCPLSFNLSDFKKIIESIWKYGNVEVSEVAESRIVYVSKHSMKEDRGCELQQKVSPIFRRQSTYNGGIGKDLINDETMLANYYKGSNYTFNGVYKVNIPRYVKKKLHPDTYSDEELIDMSRQSYATLAQKIFTQFGVREDNIVKYVTGFTFTEWWSMYDMSAYYKNTAIGYDILKYKCAVSLMHNKNLDICRQELRDYYDHKFQKHREKLKKDGYLITDI